MTISRRQFLSGSAAVAAGALTGTRHTTAAQGGTLTVWGFEGTLDGIESQVGAFNA
jgi:hypothetical protein